MDFMIGRFKTDNVEVWKQKISSDKEAHHEAGLHFARVWKNIDNPKEIFFLFEVDDLRKAKSFLEKACALDKEKQAKGEIPDLVFLESA